MLQFVLVFTCTLVSRIKADCPLPPATLEEVRDGTVVTHSGLRMPRIGVGTATGQRKEQPVLENLFQCGVRLFDTGEAYFNEMAVKRAIAKSGAPREEFVVVTKVWPFKHFNGKDRGPSMPLRSAAEVTAAFERHLARLELDYVDVLLLHWPTAFLVDHWNALRLLRQRGLVRHLGLSNVNVTHLEHLKASVSPGVDVREYVPTLVQTELSPLPRDMRVIVDLEALVAYAERRDIVLMSHSTLRGGLDNNLAKQLATRLGRSLSQILLRYALQRGFVALFSTKTLSHAWENIGALDSLELDSATMTEMSCWRGTQTLPCTGRAVVGIQRNDGARRHLQLNYDGVYPAVRLRQPARDPVNCPNRGPFDELAACPRVEVASPAMPPLGRLLELHPVVGIDGNLCKQAHRRHCETHLNIQRTQVDVRHELGEDPARYMHLVRVLAAHVTAFLDDKSFSIDRWATQGKGDTFRGAQHVTTLPGGHEGSKETWYMRCDGDPFTAS